MGERHTSQKKGTAEEMGTGPLTKEEQEHREAEKVPLS